MAEEEQQRAHCGIFTIKGDIPIQGLWRDITYQPVRDGIWSASEGIYRTVFIEGDKGVVAFDTLTTPGTATAYRGAIGRVYPQKDVHTIIYSHDHIDHTGYAADFAPDADILAHALADRSIRAHLSEGQLPATETFNGEYFEFNRDGVHLELFYPGPTHGDGQIAAYFPESKVMFMADSAIPGVGYTFWPDWHVNPYTENMRRLLELDWDIFVPSHFWLLSRDQFIETLETFDDELDAAIDAIAAGVDPNDLGEVTNWAMERFSAKYERSFRFYEYIGQNLMFMMQQQLSGGWGLEGVAAPTAGPLARN